MKAILVIDIPDDVKDAYGDFTVDYDLRGTPKDDQKVNESIKYVEDCPLKPMPLKRETHVYWNSVGIGSIPTHEISDYDKGWNDCVEFLEGSEYD